MASLLLPVLLTLVLGAPGLPAVLAPGVPGASGQPAMAWAPPLPPPLVVLRGFAPPPSQAPWLPGHRGVDLAAVAGARVLADGAGLVTFAARVAGLGVVVVAHSAHLRSTFEPVTASVAVGAQVAAGDVLGQVETGHAPLPSPVVAASSPICPGRPCLHWGMLRDDVYVDPLMVTGLSSGAAPRVVRLLPLAPVPVSRSAPGAGPPMVRRRVPDDGLGGGVTGGGEKRDGDAAGGSGPAAALLGGTALAAASGGGAALAAVAVRRRRRRDVAAAGGP